MDFTGFMGGGGGYSLDMGSTATAGDQTGGSFVGGSINKAAPAAPGDNTKQILVIAAIAVVAIYLLKK